MSTPTPNKPRLTPLRAVAIIFGTPLMLFILFMFFSMPYSLQHKAAFINEITPFCGEHSSRDHDSTIVRSLSVYAIITLLFIGSVFQLTLKAMYSNIRFRRSGIFFAMSVIVISYFVIVHFFASVYLILVCIDPTSIVYEGVDLNKNGMDAVSAYYFSLTTIATVGFGDIHPFSTTAKIFVMVEIILGLLYTVLVFSVLAEFIRRGGTDL
jgi:hypothetical protein